MPRAVVSTVAITMVWLVDVCSNMVLQIDTLADRGRAAFPSAMVWHGRNQNKARAKRSHRLRRR